MMPSNHRQLTFLLCCWSWCLSLILGLQENEETSTSPSDSDNLGVFEWLQTKDDFYFNPKLSMYEDIPTVNKSIDTFEVLFTIPASVILMNTKITREAKIVDCALFETLWEELQLGNDSDFFPYLSDIFHKQKESPAMPAMWSNIGKRLVDMIMVKNFRLGASSWKMLPKHMINWTLDYKGCIEMLEETEEEDDYLMIGQSKNQINHQMALALMTQHQVDRSMFVPLYDHLRHHHLKANVQHIVRPDSSVSIIALEPLLPGQILYRPSQACIHNCIEQEQYTMLDSLKMFGYIQDFPHYWNFPFGVSFIYDGRDHMQTSSRPALTWIEFPTDEWQVKLLDIELDRQLDLYSREIEPSRDTVPLMEWEAINDLSTSIRLALEYVIEEADESDFLFPFELGGKYKEPEEEEESEDEDVEPECYDDGTCTNPDHMTQDKDNYDDNKDPWTIDGCNSTYCGLDDIRRSRGCEEHIFSTIHNQTAWSVMRAAYIATVGPEKATLDFTYDSGMKVGFKVSHSPGRGRGIFSTQSIEKGALVWQGDNTAGFENGIQFRKFLASLPDLMTCDLINWCYTSVDEKDDKKFIIECDLDEASLINGHDDPLEYNIGCPKSWVKNWPKDCNDSAFALRDISIGEELTTDYTEFSTASWEYFGLPGDEDDD